MIPSDAIDGTESRYIDDDWLGENFINKIPPGVEVVTIFDCCHSGTLLDLFY